MLACITAPWLAVSPAAQTAKPAPSPYYFDPQVLRLFPLLPPPPSPSSATTREELALLHRIEATRTPAEVAAAQADDDEEDIFSYRGVAGEGFTAAELPLTAALSAHVHNEEGAASDELKRLFARPRPYQADATLHPVCKTTTAFNSYPSGHTLSGYLLAFTLIQMLPEKKQQILDRADDYAHNRLVCGVHYPSDLEASRKTAYAIFGYMMATPRFARELQAARTEVRTHLGLTP